MRVQLAWEPRQGDVVSYRGREYRVASVTAGMVGPDCRLSPVGHDAPGEGRTSARLLTFLRRPYYKVTSTEQDAADGAGLSHEALYRGFKRFHWHRWAAESVAQAFNVTAPPELQNTYAVEERFLHADGNWDDDGDQYAAEELGFVELDD